MEVSNREIQKIRGIKIANIAIIVIQIVIVAYLFKLDWDSHGGPATPDGLRRNFSSFMSTLLIYFLALFIGTCFSAVTRHWKSLLVQWIIPLICMIWILIPAYNPVLDAKDYQHLVGITKEDV